MKDQKLKQIDNFINNKFLINFFYIFFLISLFLIYLAVFYHPLVGDDYYYKEFVKTNSNFYDYFVERYSNWTGRFSQIIFSFWVFSSDFNLLIFKALLIPLIPITFNFFLKKIIKLNLKLISVEFIILFISLWFILPAINETIFWISGSIAYLIPIFFSLIYLGLFNEKKINKNIPRYIFYLVSSFLAGSSHLQAFIGCFVLSTYFVYINYKKDNSNFLNFIPFYTLFLFGGLILILAPGNFNRLDYVEDYNFVATIYKSFLFIASSIFYLGDIQSSTIYFLIIFLLFFLFSKKFTFKLFFNSSNYIWIIAFASSLLVVIPAINTVSTRLIFFPILFLTIYFLKLIFYKFDLKQNLKIKNIVFYFLITSFFLQSFLGAISNYVYKKENILRMKKIESAKKLSLNQVLVSHYTIIPSRYTYIQTPEHDQAFLEAMSKIHKIDIKFDKTLPRSKNIRKDIKYFFK